jgi:F0F1-type ATP synthase membrane subunit b/b'
MQGIIRPLVLIFCAVALCAFVLACGGESEAPRSQAAPAAAAKKPAPSVQQISADAKRCLDLVKAERYADAIDPCKRALEETANADVQQAYDEATAAVKREAQAAGVQAASDSLSGKPADEAAKDAATNALRNLGGGSSE